MRRTAEAVKLLRELPRTSVQEALRPPALADAVTATRGRTAFSWACWWGLQEVVELVIDHFPEEARAGFDFALAQAARSGQSATVRLLVAAFPEEATAAAGREFAEACRGNRLELVKLFQNRWPQEAAERLDRRDTHDATTPVYWMCRHGLVGALRSALQAAPGRVRDALGWADRGGRTPLAWACQLQHEGVVKLMLQYFPSLDVLGEPSPEAEEQEEDEELELSVLPEMVSSTVRKTLQQQSWRVIGSHSAIKMCRWTRHALRGEGQCYKHTFYGISSHRCMESTPSLACANKCTFCWRNHENPVATAWDFQTDDPEWIVDQSIQNHLDLVSLAAASPAAVQERIEEARGVRHVALSLVGEPVLYPRFVELIAALHRRRISTFVVTNGQFPDELERAPWVTQLYVSVDAPTAEELKKVGRPLFRDYWERLQRSLKVLQSKRPRQRTVCRMTVLKGVNMHEHAGYAELMQLSDCDFIEVKGATWSKNNATGMAFDNMPNHLEVRTFAEDLAAALPAYGVACEHEHSCAVLLARRDRFLEPTGRWRTWIDFDRFADAALAGEPLEVQDFAAETPDWALAGPWDGWTQQGWGMDPVEQRVYHKPPPQQPMVRAA